MTDPVPVLRDKIPQNPWDHRTFFVRKAVDYCSDLFYHVDTYVYPKMGIEVSKAG